METSENCCVKVAVHIRPLIGDERLQGCKECVTITTGKPQVPCIFCIFFFFSHKRLEFFKLKLLVLLRLVSGPLLLSWNIMLGLSFGSYWVGIIGIISLVVLAIIVGFLRDCDFFTKKKKCNCDCFYHQYMYGRHVYCSLKHERSFLYLVYQFWQLQPQFLCWATYFSF